ncbi:MAG: SpoIIE family protein phosphatase, partial [Burkholderiaceae bacterium]|nr:SpoIIE family protein phosphatase [Burkholderiaceae bacterium]
MVTEEEARILPAKNLVTRALGASPEIEPEVQDLDVAEEARILPAKNLVTRALGASPEIEPEVQDLDVAEGDLILLCSDGLTEMVGSYEIAGLLAAQADMHETARRLVDLANEA